jgi:pilus assembly protein Flp/PilA
MKKLLNKIRKNEAGATAIEYGLIAALISVVIISAITLVGTRLGGVFNGVANSLVVAR